jgi:hypothetical protein
MNMEVEGSTAWEAFIRQQLVKREQTKKNVYVL